MFVASPVEWHQVRGTYVRHKTVVCMDLILMILNTQFVNLHQHTVIHIMHLSPHAIFLED